jgi:carboxymethylenebutenolidase
MTTQIIPAKDGGTFEAYVAMPAQLPAPTVVLIQEIFGVNQEMRTKCDELAAQGYIAVCPDLFWRLQPGIQLTDKTKAEWDRAIDLMNRFDIDKGLEDLRSTVHVYKGHALGNGRVATLGYCLGGKLAYLMAARSPVDCSISFYGVGLDALLDESRNIKKPLMLHIAEEDKFVPKDAQSRIKVALDGHRRITLYSYPGVNHAFARGNGVHYDKEAATLANERTLAFLEQNLKQAKLA